MTSDIKSQISQAARELQVDKPVMSYRVVGDRLELHLLGGAVVTWRPQGDLAQMDTADLRRLAAKHHIRGRSKMDRAALIEALQLHRQDSDRS